MLSINMVAGVSFMAKEVKELNKAIGGRVREKREALNLSRETFAEIAGVSQSFINEIERGRSGMSSESLAAISQALGVSADFLIFGDNQKYDGIISILRGLESSKLKHMERIIKEIVDALS